MSWAQIKLYLFIGSLVFAFGTGVTATRYYYVNKAQRAELASLRLANEAAQAAAEVLDERLTAVRSTADANAKKVAEYETLIASRANSSCALTGDDIRRLRAIR